MAKPQTAPSAETEGTEGWLDDVRSLPLYNVEECKGRSVKGYLVDVKIFGKAPEVFKVIVVKLTAPTLAKEADAVIEVKAGAEIAIRGADIRDLEEKALDPEFVREYLLSPRRNPDGTLKTLKMKPPKQPMPLWDRKMNPTLFRRSEVCPNHSRVMTAGDTARLFLAAKSEDLGGDTSFDPKDMEQAAR